MKEKSIVKCNDYLKKFDNGAVTRGICAVDTNNYLTDITETSNIVKNANGSASVDNCLVNANALVSMNIWGFTPEFLDILEQGFIQFFEDTKTNLLKSEYLLPTYIVELVVVKHFCNTCG